MKILHDENREAELQKICEYIYNESLEFYDDPNDPYSYRCPYCCSEITGGHEIHKIPHTIHDLKHDVSCIWLIAKDLYIKETK